MGREGRRVDLGGLRLGDVLGVRALERVELVIEHLHVLGLLLLVLQPLPPRLAQLLKLDQDDREQLVDVDQLLAKRLLGGRLRRRREALHRLVCLAQLGREPLDGLLVLPQLRLDVGEFAQLLLGSTRQHRRRELSGGARETRRGRGEIGRDGGEVEGRSGAMAPAPRPTRDTPCAGASC